MEVTIRSRFRTPYVVICVAGVDGNPEGRRESTRHVLTKVQWIRREDGRNERSMCNEIFEFYIFRKNKLRNPRSVFEIIHIFVCRISSNNKFFSFLDNQIKDM